MTETKLRILYITSRADFGGGPQQVYLLIRPLIEQKSAEVFIACPNDVPFWEKFQQTVGAGNMFQIPHREFGFLNFFSLLRFVITNKIDVIHSHGKGGGIYGRLLTLCCFKKTIHTFQGIHIAQYSPLKRAAYLALERFFSIFTSKIVASSSSEGEKLISLKIAPPSKITVIPNGIEIPEEWNQAKHPETKPLKILSISRCDYAKNTELIIPIMQSLEKCGELDKFEFVIIGDGPNKALIEKQVHEAGYQDYVNFTGHVKSITDIMLQAFVFLSTSRSEGMPLSLLEAMAFGIPVIASKVRGNVDVVKHEKTGFLYELDRVEDLTASLKKLTSSSDLWREFSNNSREVAKREFSAETMSAKTFNLYQ